MPSLSDLFGINAAALNTTPQRMRNLPPAPEAPGVMGKPFSPEYLRYQKPTSEWDYASGKPSVTVEIEALPDGSHRAVQIKGGGGPTLLRNPSTLR